MRAVYAMLAVGLVLAGLSGDTGFMAIVMAGIVAALIRAAMVKD